MQQSADGVVEEPKPVIYEEEELVRDYKDDIDNKKKIIFFITFLNDFGLMLKTNLNSVDKELKQTPKFYNNLNLRLQDWVRSLGSAEEVVEFSN